MVTTLTIAGSDSGGGAGIQADLKTFHQFGVYGASVITALTAQNTRGVSAIHVLPPEFVAEQYLQVITDFEIAAAKTGMLANAEIIEALADVLEEHPPPILVVDPVMVSKSGAVLLEESAISVLQERILPLATLLTPNLHEVRLILDSDPLESVESMFLAAEKLHALGPGAVLVKGGHLPVEEEAVDVLYDGRSSLALNNPRLRRKHTHGTGCTYSAAITAGLAKGKSVTEAVLEAKSYVTEAIRSAPGLGKGIGPLNHFAPPDMGPPQNG